MGRLRNILRNIRHLMDPPAEPVALEAKSLRDAAITGQYDSAAGLISITPTVLPDGYSANQFFKKRNVRMLRNYAEYSLWVRAAINIYVNTIRRAELAILPIDPREPVNEENKAAIEALLKNPSPTGDPYSTIKAKMVEDYLVLGHGAILKELNKDLTPRSLDVTDAARFAFNPLWDGRDKTQPRYYIVDASYTKVLQSIPDEGAMVLIDCPRSYDFLGLSHCEILDFSIRAILEGEDYLKRNVFSGYPDGILNLGKGITKQQIDDFRQQLNQAKNRLGIVGGLETEADFIRFGGTEQEMRVLDTIPYFIRQVAAVFNVSTQALKLQVDQTRANAATMHESDQEGPSDLLWQIRQVENRSLVAPFNNVSAGDDNLMIDYPIMSRVDERQQAEISKIANGGRAWRSTNEIRYANGDPAIELPIANEVLIDQFSGPPIPLSALNAMYFSPDGKLNPANTQVQQQPDDPNSEQDNQGKDEPPAEPQKFLSDGRIN